MVFVNRVSELRSLDHLFDDDQAKLALLFGRRRLGKTVLLAHALEERGGLYFTIPEQTSAGILRHLNTEIQSQTGRRLQYASIRDFLGDLPNHGRRLVVLDEVQRLFEADKSAPSHLQELWDKGLKDSDLVLFLCGSVIGTLSRLRDAKSPLYGRFAWVHHIQPFTYGAVRLFYPNATEEERVMRFAVFGATPYYHDLTARLPLETAIRRAFLDEGAPLREEPRVLFQIEVRVAERYHEILQALGAGDRTVGAIADRYQQKGSDYTVYITRLRDDLQLISSNDPLHGKKRGARIYFRDPFFGFYYRFIYPRLGMLDIGGRDQLIERLEEDLPDQAGRAFEEVARQTLIALNGKDHQGVPIAFTELGAWWDGDEELDAVATSKEVAYAVEAKFTSTPIGYKVIEDLLRRAELFRRVSGRPRVVPILFTKSPLGHSAKDLAEKEGVLVLGIADVAAIFDSIGPDQATKTSPKVKTDQQ